jgi:hypothetical protein
LSAAIVHQANQDADAVIDLLRSHGYFEVHNTEGERLDPRQQQVHQDILIGLGLMLRILRAQEAGWPEEIGVDLPDLTSVPELMQQACQGDDQAWVNLTAWQDDALAVLLHCTSWQSHEAGVDMAWGGQQLDREAFLDSLADYLWSQRHHAREETS